MSNLKSSPWAQARFGVVAADMTRMVPLAIHQAHGLAMDAHVSSQLSSNDAYGATLNVTQHEQLVEFSRDIPGVSIRRPASIVYRFELVVLDDPPVVLYPLRYATDKTTPREKAKLRRPVSELRKSLLAMSPSTISGQLTLDQAELDYRELEAQLAEEQAVLEQLAAFGRVVTVGFASNPSNGIFDLGWGELELVDEKTGEVKWQYWEELPPPGQVVGTAGSGPKSPLAPLGRGDKAGRFDDAPLSEELGLMPRPPAAGPPSGEPELRPQDTGTDESE